MTTSVSSKSALEQGRRVPTLAKQQPGYRAHERRWRDASFFLVERRKGKAWMYGSTVLAGALWTYIYFFVHFK
jgi:hypothetical protein